MDDELVKIELPLVVAINDDFQKIYIRRSGNGKDGNLFIRKTGDAMIQIKTLDGTVILSNNSTDSIDIMDLLNENDTQFILEGSQLGDAMLTLIGKSQNSEENLDKIAIKVVKSDIVFRRGSAVLASFINETYTHGGIDWETKVTDTYNDGPREITLSDFYNEASNPQLKIRVRLKKEHFMSRRIWAKVFDNMKTKNYLLPTGLPKAWNVFTTSDNYITSNCDEFIREQFRKAVKDVYSELTNPQHKVQFTDTYYANGNVKELASGLHKIPAQFNLPSPGTGTAIAALEAFVNSTEGSAVSNHHFEGTLVTYWFVAGKRYALAASCPLCGEYPPIPWQMMLLTNFPNSPAAIWQEAHLTTVTPDSFMGSEFFETITF